MDEATRNEVLALIAEANKPILQQIQEQGKNLEIVATTVAGQKPAEIPADNAAMEQATAAARQERERLEAVNKAKRQWLAQHAPKLPEVYQAMIPDTDDPKILEEAGAKAVKAFEADFRASGLRVVSPAEAGAEGQPPQARNRATMSARDLLQMR